MSMSRATIRIPMNKTKQQMFTFTIKLTDIPNIQDDSYITQLETKKSQ